VKPLVPLVQVLLQKQLLRAQYYVMIACSSLLILLFAHSEFLGRILSSPALGYLGTDGLSAICRLAKGDRLHCYMPVRDAIAEDILWKALSLPGWQAPVRLAAHR
jgi:hypothetical protein